MENLIKPNGDKCQLLVTTEKSVSINIAGSNVKNKMEQKLLGIKFDSSLSFKGHITSLCKKASQKPHALARIVNCMDLPKKKVLMKALITSQFNYCPLIWMFHSRTLTNNMKRLHEKALRIVYSDFKANFDELLEKDGVHQINFLILTIEIFEFLYGLSSLIMNEVF